MGPQSRTLVGDLCLEDMGIVVERVHDDPPEARPNTIDVPGRDGEVLRELTYGPRDITLECRVFAPKWSDFDRVIDEISAALMDGQEHLLSVRTHPGEHYMAYLSSVMQDERIGGTGIGYLELAFVASDPWRYGREGSVTVPSGGAATFLVGGTAPAKVSVRTSYAVRSSGSSVWGVRFDEGDFMHVALPSISSRRVEIDADDRTVKVANATDMITLDASWPKLEPGTHVARMDQGTGAATLTWIERYL